MYAKLNCKVVINTSAGKTLSFTALNHCEIDNSIYNLGTSAKIKIPASARLRVNGNLQTDSVQVGKQFARGDKITVSLGYNDDLKEEFVGYIYRVNYTTPLEIECEGYEFLLRSALSSKTWASTTLKDVIKYVVSGVNISVHDQIPDINLVNYIIPSGRSKLEALQELKEKYGLTAYFIKDQLYVGLAYLIDLGSVKYTLGVNTVKDNDLKYHFADDVKLKIKAVLIKNDNTRLECEIGDSDGQQRPLFFYNLSSLDELKKLAQEEMQKYKYSGYEGKFTAFLVPYAQPAMKAVLTDPVYSEKSGTFYITAVKVEFGRSGARRIVDIGIKI